MTLFRRRNLEDYTDSLAAYMPGGELFTSKSIHDSNFRKLLRGMAGELFRVNGLLREYSPGIIPDETIKFIEEWESALGIPDSCFKATGTIDERRRDILVKLASLGVQTAQDFVDLAAIFGITVTVTAGLEEIQFPLVFPVLMFTTETEARFTIVIEFTGNDVERFTYEFPILFGSGDIAILECLFNKLKPANCNLIFQSS
jgi:uncharacterized protein YmfQ (DUF2313 family)